MNEITGGPQLSDKTMEYASKLPQSSDSLEVAVNDKSVFTSQWASKVYPAFPVFYWSSLGLFKVPPPKYGIRTQTFIFPVLWVMRDSVYDETGLRTNSSISFNLALAIGYEDWETPETSDFRTGILWIPGLGPFLGAGPKFFQFFWVPFTNYK